MLKSYAHQRETAGLAVILFIWELLLKKIICCQREEILSFKSSNLWYGKSLLPYLVTSLECYYFYYAHL